MSRKRKQEIADLEPAVEETASDSQSAEEAAPSERKVPFAHWFDKLVKSGKIRAHQDEALLVFLKKQGLKAAEDENVYNRAFEKF